MKWRVFDFLDARGRSTVRAMLEDAKVPKDQVAAFRAKMDALSRGGPEMSPGLISGPIKRKHCPITGIYEMKIKGNKGWVQLRPHVCYGPFEDDVRTITVLVGAVEKGNKLEPEDYLERADANRAELLADRSRRRILRIPRESAA